MKFLINKEDLYNGIKLVGNVAAIRSVQPVLYNILIETNGSNSIKLTATDLELTISTIIDAKVDEEGKITLPSKKLNDLVSRLSDSLVSFEMEDNNNQVKITCDNSKFEIIGISASEFPNMFENLSEDEDKFTEIEMKPFVKSIKEASYAAANFETNNLLSGVVCNINDNILEMASTDGNRLARVREKISTPDNKNNQMIIPSKTTNEFLKMSTLINDSALKICNDKSKLILKTEKTILVSNFMEGQYPKYNQLIPDKNPKTAIINKSKLLSALERVSVMVNEKTSIVKFEFSENKLTLKADTPESGASEESFEIEYKSEDMLIAFNYKYVSEALKNMECENVQINLNTNLSATIFRPDSEEDYISLIMPVQIRD